MQKPLSQQVLRRTTKDTSAGIVARIFISTRKFKVELFGTDKRLNMKIVVLEKALESAKIRIVSELSVELLNDKASDLGWIRACRQTEKEIIDRYLRDGFI